MAKITIEIDDAELWSGVFGSGFETYPWWVVRVAEEGTDWDTPGVYDLYLHDPDTHELVGRSLVHIDSLAQATSAALERFPGLNLHDIDAEAADMILQTLVTGKVVFG